MPRSLFLYTGHLSQISIHPLGLPNPPFHARLDALSGYFRVLLGLGGAVIFILAAAYCRSGEGTALGLLCLACHVLVASMTLVILADDAYFSWTPRRRWLSVPTAS